jgi:hypothetical protein
MQTNPLVYTIVVNWNGKGVTLECLQSLHHVTYQRQRILVVDNASSDGSVEAIRTSFPGVEVLQSESNLRFSGGSNLGMRHALSKGADLLLLLNNDTTVHPDFLTRLVSRIQSSERIGIVAPKIYYEGERSRLWFAGAEISFWTGTLKHTGIREADAGQHDEVRDIDYATGCCMLVTKAVVEKVGFLDEAYHMYSEDADWCMRARTAGFRVVFEPEARIWHKVSATAGGNLSRFKLQNKFFSNMRFFARYATWYHWLVFPWLSVLTNSILLVRNLFWAESGASTRTRQ